MAAGGAENETYMNVPEVQGISKTLQGVAQALRAIEVALSLMIEALKLSLLLGNVGAAVQIQHMERMKRQVDTMADNIEELFADVDKAIVAYETGDTSGASRFS
jgi:hypothetical protein